MQIKIPLKVLQTSFKGLKVFNTRLRLTSSNLVKLWLSQTVSIHLPDFITAQHRYHLRHQVTCPMLRKSPRAKEQMFKLGRRKKVFWREEKEVATLCGEPTGSYPERTRIFQKLKVNEEPYFVYID